MIEFVGLLPIILETHYELPRKPTILNLAQAGLFLRITLSRIQGVPMNYYASMRYGAGVKVT